MQKNKILWLALATLIGFGGIGFLLIYFGLDITPAMVFESESSIWRQLILGLLFGTGSALVGWQIVMSPFMIETRRFFTGLIQPMRLSIVEIIFISCCAGIGEEIFFRGAIQPYLGVWITAILFVALHGYLNPRNIPLSIYGIYMTLIIGGVGYLALETGLWSAVIAHTAVDVVLLYRLSHDTLPEEDDEF